MLNRTSLLVISVLGTFFLYAHVSASGHGKQVPPTAVVPCRFDSPPEYYDPRYRVPPQWQPNQRSDQPFANNPWENMRRMEDDLRRKQWEMERDMERLRRDMQADGFTPEFDDNKGIHINESFSTPRIRIDENDIFYIVTAEIPGADGQSIQVDLQGNRLSISGKREVETRQESDNKRMSAKFKSRFQRSLTLPGPVEQKGMQSEFKDEVLTLNIPKMRRFYP